MNEMLRHATADEAGILAAGAENVAVNGRALGRYK